MSEVKDVSDLRKRNNAKKAPRKKMSMTAKSALFLGIMVAVLAGVLLTPSPKDGKGGGIELHGEEREVAVYGPELPKSTVGNYPVPVEKSVVLPETSGTTEEVTYVYASDDQDCYHVSTCKFAYASGHRYTVYEAQLLGYKPCGRCNPPTE